MEMSRELKDMNGLLNKEAHREISHKDTKKKIVEK
jgi:hypothetical protein